MLITIDATFHARVDKWIEDMENYIDGMTGRNFVADAEESDREFDGTGTRKLVIDDAILIGDVALDYETPEELVDEDDLVKYPANYAAKGVPISLLKMRSGIFPRGSQNIVVSGKWGFSEETPGDIEMTATVLVAGIINFAHQSDGEVQSETIGRYSVTYKNDTQWADFERVPEVLKSYRKFSM